MFKSHRDPYGFWFWLRWISWFASSLILAAIFWTAVLNFFFGEIQAVELLITWSIAVFGSWFVLLIPFIRKKEQIWKRLNADQEDAVDAWLGTMGLFVGFCVAISLGWSLILKERVMTAHSEGLDKVWFKAVLGSWLTLMIPFLIFMYRKADAIFKTAVAHQTGTHEKPKMVFRERDRRLLPDQIAVRLKNLPETLPQGHVVTVILRDGRRIQNVFILNSSEILGVYNHSGLDFESRDILDIECTSSDQLPVYEESKWLRFEG